MTIHIEPASIVRDRVPDHRRAAVVAELFGNSYPMQLEPYVFNLADSLSADYQGAYWIFYTLSNGVWYMAPDDDRSFAVRCENGFHGTLSADAFGVTCCLYAFSHLSFAACGEIATVYARQYHLLRDYAAEHPEAPAIFAAID